MSYLRYGTLLANATLIAFGAMLGGGVVWWFGPRRLLENAEPVTMETTLASHTPNMNPTPWRTLDANDPQTRSMAWREKGAGDDGDAEAATRNAQEVASERDRTDYLQGFYGAWSKRDPQAAADHAKASWKTGETRTESIGVVVGQWAARDPRAAWQWSEANLSGPLKEQTLATLLQGWARNSPPEAARWLAESGLTTQAYFDAVGAAWAARNPREAADWAGKLEDSVARKTAENAVASEWVRQEPEVAASQFTPEISKPDAPNVDLATTIADIWGTADPAATARWVGTLPPGPGRDEAASTLATVWAASDMDAAVAWSQTLTDSEVRQRVIQHLGTTWGAIEPDRALEWLGSLPATEAADGIEGALHSWAGTDPVGLRQWIEQAAENPLADQAKLSLGDVLADTDMLEAMGLALGIRDPARRDQAVGRFYNEWRKTDPAGAQEWTESQWSHLPQSTRNTLGRQ